MQLKSYLKDRRLSAAEFGRQIGVANGGVVAKYLNGDRVPRPSIMREIVRVTNGQVRPDDFFDIPADEKPTDQVIRA